MDTCIGFNPTGLCIAHGHDFLQGLVGSVVQCIDCAWQCASTHAAKSTVEAKPTRMYCFEPTNESYAYFQMCNMSGSILQRQLPQLVMQ